CLDACSLERVSPWCSVPWGRDGAARRRSSFPALYFGFQPEAHMSVRLVAVHFTWRLFAVALGIFLLASFAVPSIGQVIPPVNSGAKVKRIAVQRSAGVAPIRPAAGLVRRAAPPPGGGAGGGVNGVGGLNGNNMGNVNGNIGGANGIGGVNGVGGFNV